MKTLITISLILSFNAFGQSDISQQELCGYYGSEDKVIYDYNYRMGPERDQADTGSCYAFSVAALLEEDLYLRLIGKVPNSTFDNNISVIDIQRCDMETGHGLGYKTAAQVANDYAFYAMECSLYKEGACFEKDAPFETKSQYSFTTQNGRFIDFMSIYDEWVSFKKTPKTDAERVSFFNDKTNYFFDYVNKDNKDPIGGDGYSFAHFVRTFYSAKNRIHFLNLVLTTNTCEQNRLKFENRKYVTDNYYTRNYTSKIPYRKEKMNLIKKIFANNRSSLIILANPTHASVISGMRMSEGVCQLYLRSSAPSWASSLTSGWFTGWADATSILTETISIKYLQETSAEEYQKDKELFYQKNIAKSYEEEKLYDSPDKW
jgi:hypothetical protein